MRNSLVEAAAMKRQFEQLRTAHLREAGEKSYAPKNVTAAHGTPSAYAQGCRCEPCRLAKSEDGKARYQAQKVGAP